MKFALIFLVGCSAVSPIEKTIQLLSDLQAKVVADGENEAKTYEEFTAFCHDESMNLQFAIKTGKADAERASATIAESTARIEGAEAKIDELATTLATSQEDLSSATKIREQEASDFAKIDADLAETIDMIGRAHGIIEREMNKHSFVQTDAMPKVTAALQEVLNAAAINSNDKAKIQALVQTDNQDLELQPAGAPDPAAYASQSGGILSVLEDMLEKSKAQRAEGQKAEMNAAFDFKMIKQKLEDSMANGDKQLSDTKKAKAAAEEEKAVAEGELATANKGVSEDSKTLHDLQEECMSRGSSYEESQAERSNELAALAKAKSILNETAGGAAGRTYSFVQLSTTVSVKASAKQDRVVALIQGLAKDGSTELAQLASRIQSAQLMGADPFAKVKGMISEMIEKLVAEAQKEASHKAFCDKEMSETKAKRDDKQEEVDDLQTKIDKATAKIAKLKEEIATLESELASIAKASAEATTVRNAEKEEWGKAKADFEAGVEGVGMALQVLRDYYAEQEDDTALMQTSHDKATGAASGIIGMLEVVESDFSKMLADGTAGEALAQEKYDTLIQDFKVQTTEKTTAAKYKTKDVAETQNSLAGNNEDIEVSQKELDAILDYWEKLQPMCIAKPEPYAERKRRREAEIAGLKQALQILEEEAGSSFLQIRSK